MALGFSKEEEVVVIKAVSCELNADKHNNTWHCMTRGFNDKDRNYVFPKAVRDT